MTLVLDQPRDAGDRRLAILCDTQISAHAEGPGLWAAVFKMPVAVLVADADGLTAMDLSGRPLDPDTLDAACPGLKAQMHFARPPE